MHNTLNSQVASERVQDMLREAEQARLARGERPPSPRRAGGRRWTPLTLRRRRAARA